MLKLVTLASVSASEMSDVLADEREAWLDRLGWDFSPTTALVARSVGSRAFTGFALHDGRRVVGYSYHLEDAHRALLGSVHALPEADREGASSRLVERTFAHLVGALSARRIESQFLHFGSDDPSPVFVRWGARRFPRQFLVGSADRALEALGPDVGPGLRPFRSSDLKSVAEVVHRSFVGSADAEMSECYASEEGCEAFVEGVLSRSGCGSFEPRASFLHVEGGRALGVVLASRIGPATGHIVQISVDPDAQGRGIGRALMRAATEALLRRSLARLSLSVSVANARARGWYLALGLEPRLDFSAWVR